MDFRIADTFTDALARLPAPDQKAVKTSAFDLQTNPSASRPADASDRQIARPEFLVGASEPRRPHHPAQDRREPAARLCRPPRQSLCLGRAAAHRGPSEDRRGPDRRSARAGRRARAALSPDCRAACASRAKPRSSRVLSDDDLLSVGVPTDWLADIRAATEDAFLELSAHLPAEAAESLLQFATTGVLNRPAPAPADPYAHPDAQRRFRVIENVEELAQALDSPWDKWMVFLHPSQREIVEKDFAGPARVAGSAGTGKTVVALHRAVRLAKTLPDARVLLATFSDPLAASLATKVRLLAGPETSVIPTIRGRLFAGRCGRAVGTRDRPARARRQGRPDRAGAGEGRRGSRLGREAEFPALGMGACRRRLAGRRTWPTISPCRGLGATGGSGRNSASNSGRSSPPPAPTWRRAGSPPGPAFSPPSCATTPSKSAKPFSHIVIDEAQDLGVPELRFLAAISPAGENGLFFSGDLGQRIFQQPFSWKALGVDIRGRAATLKVNYRTSHQIRRAADRLLPGPQRDVDGVLEERKGTVSVFNGPEPKIIVAQDEAAETSVVAAFVREALIQGVAPREIGVFVRTPDLLTRARAAVQEAGAKSLELSERGDDPGERISIGTMHLAKGLEFKAVAVMACDEDALPLRSRIDSAADETELEDVYDTERQLLYVAATRARDRLLVTGVKPASEFLRDLGG